MGDRGTIRVDFTFVEKEEERLKSVYLYTHGGGHRLDLALAAALERGRSRWDDPQYLCRIIFCELMGHEEVNGLLGYGISPRQMETNRPILVVDTRQHLVWSEDESREMISPPASYESYISWVEAQHASDVPPGIHGD